MIYELTDELIDNMIYKLRIMEAETERVNFSDGITIADMSDTISGIITPMPGSAKKTAPPASIGNVENL